MGKLDMMYDLIDHDLTNSEFSQWIREIKSELKVISQKRLRIKSGFAKKVVNTYWIRKIDSEFNVHSR